MCKQVVKIPLSRLYRSHVFRMRMSGFPSCCHVRMAFALPAEYSWASLFACPFGLWFAGLSSFIKKPIPAHRSVLVNSAFQPLSNITMHLWGNCL